jgi:SAM-dependent methyltransferase
MSPAAAQAIPQDLSGRSVLDIGCRDGLHATEMKRRGATRVVGIDTSEGNLALARETAAARGAEIDFRRMAVYELGALGERFDVVLFLGGLSHLRYPLLALDLIYEHAAADLLVVQTLLRGASVVHRLEDDYPFAKTAVFVSDFRRSAPACSPPTSSSIRHADRVTPSAPDAARIIRICARASARKGWITRATTSPSTRWATTSSRRSRSSRWTTGC